MAIDGEPELEPLPEREMYFTQAPGHLSVPATESRLASEHDSAAR
jgi:hypothetical protein